MRGAGGIWQALAAARRANSVGSGEPIPRVASAGLTRRRLIGALAASAVVPSMPDVVWAAPRVKIAIVGGGLAGLVALDMLVRAGLDATLYEARATCGGRIRSVTGALGDGLVTDDGGQLVNSDHDDLIALCRRFALPLVDRQTAPSRDLLLTGSGVADQGEVVRALKPLAARIARDARAVDRSTRAAASIDALSAAHYLDRIGATGVLRRWIEATIRTEYGVEPSDASALELVWNLPTVDGNDLEILSASDERYVIGGGSQRVIDALATLHADRIRTGAVLQRIGSGGAQLRLSFANGTTVEADRVVVAVPASLYRSLTFDVALPNVWRDFLATVDLGRVEKLVVGTNSRPWQRVVGPAGAVWDGPGFAEAWDATAGQPTLTSGALAFLPGGAQVDGFAAADMRKLADGWSAAVEGTLPGFTAARNGRLRRTAWHADPFAKGSYVNYRPGQISRFLPLLSSDAGRVARVGRLVFAGEHVSDAFPGYMNGAAETGRRAAEAIIAEVRGRARRG